MKHHIRNIAAAAGLLCATMAGAGAATYTTILNGQQTGSGSSGIGAAVINFDETSHVLEISAAFSGLLSDNIGAQIHTGSGAASIATPDLPGFPLAVRTGAYSHRFDTSQDGSWNSEFISANGGTTAGAEAALLAALTGGGARFNILSTGSPTGEIGGVLTAAPVPEPSTMLMLGLGAPAVLLLARRRRSS